MLRVIKFKPCFLYNDFIKIRPKIKTRIDNKRRWKHSQKNMPWARHYSNGVGWEEQIKAQARDYELIRLKSVEQSNRIANLEAIHLSQAKHHQSVVSGYKSQLVKHNEQIKLLKAKLTITEDKNLKYCVDNDIYFNKIKL